MWCSSHSNPRREIFKKSTKITEQALFAYQYCYHVESSCILPLLVDFPDHPQQFNTLSDKNSTNR
ncbi:hypothetical protein NXF25_002454 [Crotalus adamanteus]|uniref:Uncharacterized protein n=1 Tax=Crotalus adamanteus TaxID=8729 RepID=A0AAW1C9T3_CROAD